jgi:uncharacterized membrane protein HdeD (DUF308 family)
MLFFRRNKYEVMAGGGSVMGSGLFLLGFLSLLFGLAILAAPELLAYIVASFFIVTGISCLSAWWRLRK